MALSSSDCESDDGKNGEDFDLSKIFGIAQKLKSAQLSKIRKEYERSPSFIKATQVYASRNNEWKELSVTQRIEKCESFKEEGNNFFNKKNNKDYTNALNSYSKGISIFRYFEKKDERGEHLELKDYIFEGYTSYISFWQNEENFNRAQLLILSLLLNCATACLALRLHANVVWCCKAVLKYDASNIKALYKMCQSHENLDTTFDLEYALKYITKAKKISPPNKAVTFKFDQIKKLLKIQNKKDKQQFYGL
eukprot:UN01955